ncbi:MAG TPA: 50S ribosomal protein L15 [Candidatus Magasanikbacteria bacterium]|jgi:large subunit ribosomal protein L15|nr:50S ribosomal protein L15 [Candidatus Magasanikbacteria bacterium]HQF57101.1 50S ribosomal protein L15 [Candidatus Magasanikbacteria bacterium]HQL52879.1 50S ribosomal protein L15 [Candidatus Magasanikbacteria bacterium]
MSLSPNTIKPAKGAKRKSKRLGRGIGSGKGTTAARGTKGQKARSGGKSRRQIRAFKASLQKVPKLRGFKTLQKTKETVTLAMLEKVAEDNKIITPIFLEKKGVISSAKNGVKIVSSGELKKKVEINGCLASKKAVEMIEKVGGSIKF